MTTPLEEFNRIVRPVEQQMMLTVWHVLADAHDAEDAFQDAMTIILKRWNRIVKHVNPHALLLKICADCAYDHLRKKIRLSRRRREISTLDQSLTIAKTTDQLVCCESRQEIVLAIAKLSHNQAVAFILRNIEDQSYVDIAAALGCNESTVRKHVERARHRLSILLQNLAPQRNLS